MFGARAKFVGFGDGGKRGYKVWMEDARIASKTAVIPTYTGQAQPSSSTYPRTVIGISSPNSKWTVGLLTINSTLQNPDLE